MKKALGITYAAATFLSLAPLALAAESVSVCPNDTFSPLCHVSFSGVLGPLVSTIFILATIVALLYLIWGGFKWLTSGGNKEEVAKAREHIIAALIGLVIIFLSYFILNLVFSFFFGSNISSFTLPRVGLQ